MILIKSRIVEFVDYVVKKYKNSEEFFPDFQKSEELKIQAEIDEVIYYLISNLLGDDLATLLNMVYSNPESGIAIFSNFQNVVAKIYEMNVAFNINK